MGAGRFGGRAAYSHPPSGHHARFSHVDASEPASSLAGRTPGRVKPAARLAASAAAGYVAALSLDGGWFTPNRVNRYAVPRVNIPSGLSAHGFALRTSGFAGVPVTPPTAVSSHT